MHLKSRWGGRTYQVWETQGKRSIAPRHCNHQGMLKASPIRFGSLMACLNSHFIFISAILWIALSSTCTDPNRAVIMSILPITRWLQSTYGFIWTTWILRELHHSAQAGLELAIRLRVRSFCLSLHVLGLQACTITTGWLGYFVYSKPMATEDLYFFSSFSSVFCLFVWKSLLCHSFVSRT